jgi:hypothetical protein
LCLAGYVGKLTFRGIEEEEDIISKGVKDKVQEYNSETTEKIEG